MDSTAVALQVRSPAHSTYEYHMEALPPVATRDKTFYLRIAVWSAIACLVLWIGVTKGIYLLLGGDLEAASKNAEMFNAVNALFSALAFVGVIVAVLMQSKELELQREELIETRAELRRSADAQTKSEEALSRQVDTMLLSSYLSALGMLQAAYGTEVLDNKHSYSYEPRDKHNAMKAILQQIVDDLKPRIRDLSQQPRKEEPGEQLQAAKARAVRVVSQAVNRLTMISRGREKSYVVVHDAQKAVSMARQEIIDFSSTIIDPEVRRAMRIEQLDGPCQTMVSVTGWVFDENTKDDHFV